MQNIKTHIRTLEEFCDANKELTEEQKTAIKAGIVALKKDQILEAIKLLVPLLGPVAKLFIDK
jgi:hypothetical protein